MLINSTDNAYAVAPQTSPGWTTQSCTTSGTSACACRSRMMLVSQLPAELKHRVRSVDYVEKTSLYGAPAHHLAVRTDTVDFQVWVADGDKPLPQRVVITVQEGQGQSQFWAQLSDWNLSSGSRMRHFGPRSRPRRRDQDFVRDAATGQVAGAQAPAARTQVMNESMEWRCHGTRSGCIRAWLASEAVRVASVVAGAVPMAVAVAEAVSMEGRRRRWFLPWRICIGRGALARRQVVERRWRPAQRRGCLARRGGDIGNGLAGRVRTEPAAGLRARPRARMQSQRQRHGNASQNREPAPTYAPARTRAIDQSTVNVDARQPARRPSCNTETQLLR